jgi:hypothetical protein
MLELVDKQTLYRVTLFMDDLELIELTSVIVPLTKTNKLLRRKLFSIPQIEIRILKARTAAAESCLNFALRCPSIMKQEETDEFLFYNHIPAIRPNFSFLMRTNARILGGMLWRSKDGILQKRLKELEAENKILKKFEGIKVVFYSSDQRLLS